ncbi:MAG: acetoacetyl-CoA synthase [Rhodocyclales bacterium]|nr:acetoacetyl-CoA synthase [Rhodocyclales bacterium]
MSDFSSLDKPLWLPSAEHIAATRLTAFTRFVEQRYDQTLPDYAALHRWSVAQREDFWSAVWDFCGVVGDKGARRLVDGDKMQGAQWFPDARLNFACNLLRGIDERDAIVFKGEEHVQRRLSHAELYREVARLAAALRDAGVGPGDRVAAYMPNMPETIVAMLATASLGAIFSSASQDFGVQGVLDRFGQIEPKVLIAADGVYYGGKHLDAMTRIAEIVAQLPSVTHTVIVPYIYAEHDVGKIRNGQMWADFLAPFRDTAAIDFVDMPFNAPLYILFSSGTTGVPKCIVHGAGGTLLQHLKEHQLHSDIRAGDRVFYFTTCGWMMWNWLASVLASDATLLLYDGSPFAGRGSVLWDFARDEHCTLFGTSAKYLDAAAKMGLKPAVTHDLSALRAVLSTGSPLSPEASTTSIETSKRISVCHLFRAAPTSFRASCWAIPIVPSGAESCSAKAWGWLWKCSTRMARPLLDRRVSWCARALFRACPWHSGTMRMARATAPPISSAFPASGVMATGAKKHAMAA